jgi:O-succinylbenzoic acid--CoA ligase
VQSVVFTSGTTGRPKGAQITWGNHLQVALGTAARLGVLPEDRWLTCLPLYHVGGMSILFRAALFATCAVLHDGFDAARANADLDSGAANIASFVPTMLARVLDERDSRPFPASVRLLLIGGAATSDALLKRALALGAPIALTYGLSEAASQVATATPDDVKRKPGSVGRPLRGGAVRVVTAGGKPAAPGEIGELVVHGPVVMAGYLGADAPADGLHTGDLGYIDNDGDLWVVQRRDDLINSGGENIYPAEVEAVLREHPSVADALVVALEDAEWTQLPAALIVLQPGHAPNPEVLDAWCRERLSRYKRPRRYFFVDALPMTSNGKVSRALAREMVTAGSAPQS